MTLNECSILALDPGDEAQITPDPMWPDRQDVQIDVVAGTALKSSRSRAMRHYLAADLLVRRYCLEHGYSRT